MPPTGAEGIIGIAVGNGVESRGYVTPVIGCLGFSLAWRPM